MFAFPVRICVTFKVRVRVRVRDKCWGWDSDNYRHSDSCMPMLSLVVYSHVRTK